MRVWALLLACSLAAPLAAEPSTGLEALTRREQLLGFEAVGRLDFKGGQGGYCTGTLIASDLVLTAAHCMFDQNGAPKAIEGMTFRAGYVAGTALHEVKAKAVAVPPSYVPLQGGINSGEHTRVDVALVQLAAPIPTVQAAPFLVEAPRAGRDVSVLSYSKGRDEHPSWQRVCKVLQRGQGLLLFDCDVSFGASGAPVLDRGYHRARIVSIISGGGDMDGKAVAVGMELPALVASLKADLARGHTMSKPADTPAGAAMVPARRGLPASGGGAFGQSAGTAGDKGGARFIRAGEAAEPE